MEDYPQTSSDVHSRSTHVMNGGRGRGRGRGGGRFGGRGIGIGGGSDRGSGGGGGNDKVVNGVNISNPNILFTNKEWEKLPIWERRELQQSDGRKHAINKRITETCN